MKKEKILKFIKIISLSAVAVVIIAIAGVGSYAAITGDTRIFKSIGISLEGENYNIEVVENNTEFESGVSYTIDHSDAFVVTKQDNMDIYTSDGIETISGTLYIWMKIYSIDDSKCEELRNELDVEMDKMNALFKKMGYDGNNCFEEVTIGKGNYKAINYGLADGNNWDSTIRDVYIIKVGNKQNLIIETSYFLEATEGWGDTFKQLLSTLEIKNYKPDEDSNKNANKISNKENAKEEKVEGTYEGMKNKFEDVRNLRVNEYSLNSGSGGYASIYNVAEIDLMKRKATVANYYDAIDEDLKIQKRVEITLSEDEAERLYTYYEKGLENSSKYSREAFFEYKNKTSNAFDKKYYVIEADEIPDVYLFENEEDVQFLRSIIEIIDKEVEQCEEDIKIYESSLGYSMEYEADMTVEAIRGYSDMDEFKSSQKDKDKSIIVALFRNKSYKEFYDTVKDAEGGEISEKKIDGHNACIYKYGVESCVYYIDAGNGNTYSVLISGYSNEMVQKIMQSFKIN